LFFLYNGQPLPCAPLVSPISKDFFKTIFSGRRNWSPPDLKISVSPPPWFLASPRQCYSVQTIFPCKFSFLPQNPSSLSLCFFLLSHSWACFDTELRDSGPLFDELLLSVLFRMWRFRLLPNGVPLDNRCFPAVAAPFFACLFGVPFFALHVPWVFPNPLNAFPRSKTIFSAGFFSSGFLSPRARFIFCSSLSVFIYMEHLPLPRCRSPSFPFWSQDFSPLSPLPFSYRFDSLQRLASILSACCRCFFSVRIFFPASLSPPNSPSSFCGPYGVSFPGAAQASCRPTPSKRLNSLFPQTFRRVSPCPLCFWRKIFLPGAKTSMRPLRSGPLLL